MEIMVIKLQGGVIIPSLDDDAKKLERFKVGVPFSVTVKQPRNSKFHRKFMAMLNIGYEAFEPDEKEYKGMPVQKDFDRFRKDAVIAAGFYDLVSDINGNVKAQAQSISFASMDDEKFERVYSKVVDVLLQRVLKNYTRGDLDAVVDQVLGFA